MPTDRTASPPMAADGIASAPVVSDRLCSSCEAPLPPGSRTDRRYCGPACVKAGQRAAAGKPRRRRQAATIEERAADLLADAESAGECLLARRVSSAGVPAPERFLDAEGRRCVAPAVSIVFAASRGLPQVPRRRVRSVCGEPACVHPDHLEVAP